MDYLNQFEGTLPPAPKKGGVYEPVKQFGKNLCYVSGCGPKIESYPFYPGKLGSDLTENQGREMAHQCVLNILSIIKDRIGSLSRVKSFVKITVFVASADDFYNQPKVADGASEYLQEIFGDPIGIASRSAIGVSVLPGNIPVEIEALIELTDNKSD